MAQTVHKNSKAVFYDYITSQVYVNARGIDCVESLATQPIRQRGDYFVFVLTCREMVVKILQRSDKPKLTSRSFAYFARSS